MKNLLLLGLAFLWAGAGFAQSGRNVAEVFIELDDRGPFTVHLDQEMVGSATGRFRFYEVSNSSPTLTIHQGNKRLYSTRLQVRAGERAVYAYGIRQGLRLVKTLTMIRNGQYALDDFNDYAGSYNTGIVPPRPAPARRGSYSELLASIQRTSFDDDKMKLIEAYTAHEQISTDQLAALISGFSRDENKLLVIKAVTPAIYDPQRMYTLKEVFTFNSTREAFLNSMPAGPASRVMSDRDFERLLAGVKKEAFDDNRTRLIDAAASSNLLTTAQVAQLIRTYAFEDKALALAKSLHRNVADPQRYFSLKDAFKFISTRDAFLDFLSRR